VLVKAFIRSLIKAATLVVLVGGVHAASADAANASLAGTHWRLVTIDGAAADASRREPFIVLSPDGKIVGGTGCNRFGGGYTLSGAFLTIGTLATTRMYCQAQWRQERAILDALPLVASWRITGDRLELIDATGTVVAAFQAEPGAN
jgi:heat shock protein HslJ